jgi:paraquat-inducible protein B
MQDGQAQNLTQSTPVASSYQQFQQQRFVRQEQQSVQAQQAIMNAGADSFSQKVMDTITALRKISSDFVNAQKQLEAQIFAQQRQLQQMQQNIDNVCNQLQNAYKPGSVPSSSRLQ